MKILPVLLILFTLSYASAANYGEPATAVSYDFGEFIWGDMDIDGLPYDTTFIAGGGEVSANENIFFSIYYAAALVSEGNVTATENQFIVGLGYHSPVNEQIDFVIGGGLIFDWVDLEVDNITVAEDDDTGYFLEMGFRGVPTPGLELGLGLTFTDLYDDTDTSLNTYAKYFFNDGQFGIGALYQTASDVDLIGISLTWKTKK